MLRLSSNILEDEEEEEGEAIDILGSSIVEIVLQRAENKQNRLDLIPLSASLEKERKRR